MHCTENGRCGNRMKETKLKHNKICGRSVGEKINQTDWAYLKYRSKSITYNPYKIVRNDTNNDIKKMKQAYWKKFSKDME